MDEMGRGLIAMLLTAAAIVPGVALAQGVQAEARIDENFSDGGDRAARRAERRTERAERRADRAERPGLAVGAAAAAVARDERRSERVDRPGRDRGDRLGQDRFDGGRRGDHDDRREERVERRQDRFERRDDRRDWRDDRREDRRDWRDDGRGRGSWYDGRDRRGDERFGAYDGGRVWNRGWRDDRRYDWSRQRNVDRARYRLPRYYAPQGFGYGYRPFGIGAQLSRGLWQPNYWINDPWSFRL
ncbi:MAG TPA: ATP-dependent RNA helicase, partial [Sphingomonas sp.]